VTEVWVQAYGLDNYEVSSEGRVRRSTPGRYVGMLGKIMSQSEAPNGYLSVSLMPVGWVSVHRLVCASFNGPPPSANHHAAHNDGNKRRNIPENLRWATPSENNFDQDKHGTRNSPRGEKQGRHKLIESEVLEILRRHAAGEGAMVLAREFGVVHGTIGLITRRVNWKHLHGGSDGRAA
jgi:hypothetical protein